MAVGLAMAVLTPPGQALAALRTHVWDSAQDFALNASASGVRATRSWLEISPEGSVVLDSDFRAVAVAAGYEHSVILREDGTVVAFGGNDWGQCDVQDWTGITEIAAGYPVTLGLRADGTVAVAGANVHGECEVSGWTDIVEVSGGHWHSVGLRRDGTVLATGMNRDGQCDVSSWDDVVAVSAGLYHTVGLRSDGTVVAVGANESGQCDTEDWTDIVAVGAGSDHTVGLRSDGTVVVAGANTVGQSEVSDWTGAVGINVGYAHTFGLRPDGTVLAAGHDVYGEMNAREWTEVVALSAGGGHVLGLRPDGTVLATGWSRDGQTLVSHVGMIGGLGRSVGLRVVSDSSMEPYRLEFTSSHLGEGMAAKFAIRTSNDGRDWSPPLGYDGRPVFWAHNVGSYLGRSWADPIPRTEIRGIPPARFVEVVVRLDSLPGAPFSVDSVKLYTVAQADVSRQAGVDRYETAARISRSEFASAPAVVLASGAQFADALSASGLAGVLRGPVLLTRPDDLPSATREELARLNPSQVVVVGGRKAVSDRVMDQVRAIGRIDVSRLAGADRYATSRVVAHRIAELQGYSFSRWAFVVRGDSFADALAVAPLAYASGSPIVLTRPAALSAEASAAIAGAGVRHPVVIGGPGAVSYAAESALSGVSSVSGAVTRVYGEDRFQTAAQVAAFGVAQGWLNWGSVGISSGGRFADALAGGAKCGADAGPLLLTRADRLPERVIQAIRDNDAEVDEITIFGGEKAVERGVQDYLRTMW